MNPGRLSALALGSWLAIGTAGCESAPGGASEWTVSLDVLPNGASHVVNTPPTAGEEPTWWIEEDLRIGSFDEPGPTSFGELLGIALLEDGRVAVLETQSQEVRIFSPEGAHLATFGGEGEGPGELRGGFGLMLTPAGLLWVPDYRVYRWTPGGDTTLVLETPRPPVQVTQAERDSVIEVVSTELRERGRSTQLDWSKIPATTDPRSACAAF